ncbi:hypothetical protein DFJ58DRAFT_670756, partial [Suillus subalutaceus]|uniref:uncharacterized protein n=1 Tax=Suillus subalutaceus TaxID=48586 RepID=UPI001B886AA2
STSPLYNIPQLAEDGSNWITYKERAQMVIRVRGLMRYLDGQKKEFISFEIDSAGDMIKPDKTKASQTEIDDLEKEIEVYLQKDSFTKQHLFSTITDRLLLRVQNLGNALKI